MTTASAILHYARPTRSNPLHSLLLIVGGSALCAIASQVLVPLPFTPVPMNGLTFAVLLLGATLDWRIAAAAVLLFLGEGSAGLPVFAELKAGLPMLRPSGGYLMAAPFAAAAVALLLQLRRQRNLFWLLLTLLIGDAIMFGGGLAWLSRYTLATNVWHAGLIPFLPGEAVKIALLMLTLPIAWRWTATARMELSDPRD